MSKINGISIVLRDLLYIFSVKYFPNKLFKYFYQIGLFKLYKKPLYKYPSFISKKSLDSVSEIHSRKILDTSSEALNNYLLNEPSNNVKLNHETKSNFAEIFHVRNAKIIIPYGWVDPSTAEGRTQGPQILFLKKGLEKNKFNVEIIQLRDDYDDLVLNIDPSESQFIFIWSLTQVDPRSKALRVFLSSHLNMNKNATIVGVITAGPEIKLIERYMEWKKILSKVIFYEEDSEYKNEIDKIFEVVHTPYLQINPNFLDIQKDFYPSVHASCIIKHNRIAWLVVLRYICVFLNLNYHIRIISNALTLKRNRESYISNELIVEERMNYGFGFVMAHRDSIRDADLIGSFWDYYRLGVIPIVQKQKYNQISSYLIPYLDYFPCESDLDLLAILKASKENPTHFSILKLRLLDRMRSEFTPEIVIRKLLKNLSQINKDTN